MNVGEICNRVVATIDAGQSGLQAAELMRQLHIGTLVVTGSQDGGGAPVGILTDRDLVVEVMAKSVDPASVTVGDIMSTELLLAEEEDDISDTLEAMREEGVRRVPVLDEDGALIGVLALDDVLRLYARDIGTMAGIVGAQRTYESYTRDL